MKPTKGMTWGELLGPAMHMTDKAEAQEFLEDYIEMLVAEGNSRKKAKEIALSNLGYYAGYYDEGTRAHVLELFGAVHPIFGAATPTPQEAFDAGRNLGETKEENRGTRK